MTLHDSQLFFKVFSILEWIIKVELPIVKLENKFVPVSNQVSSKEVRKC